MTFDIPAVLSQIRTFLKEYTAKKHQSGLQMQQRVDQLLEKIEEAMQQSSNILNAILISPEILSKMKGLLVQRLLREFSETTFLQKYRKASCKPREEYQIQDSSLNSLIKQIYENSKPIQEELQKVTLNLETCSHSRLACQGDPQIDARDMSVGCLLRMVMEASELDLDNCFDEMLFRIFLLQQSLILIFHKTEYLLQHLSVTLEDQVVQQPKSPSVKTKRSALSQSIEIYKSNQKKKEEQASKIAQQKTSHRHVIKTDYQLVCKTEKKLPRRELKGHCCF